MRLAKTLMLLMLLGGLGRGKAHAALGEPYVPQASEHETLTAVVRVFRSATHTLHERRTAAGATIHEYVGKDTKVFAVSWKGSFRPNLRELLGTYYEVAFANTPFRRTRGLVTIRTPGLVVVMGGRPRAWFGRAYLEAALPTGLLPEDIQ
jgi:hypothetical protein